MVRNEKKDSLSPAPGSADAVARLERPITNVWPRSCFLGFRKRCPLERWPNLEERLKSLMQDLGTAINQSLSDSERIAEAIGEIKGAGYEVFLVLEAQIGFNKREDGESDGSSNAAEVTPPGRVRLTIQDRRFLKGLRITADEEA